MEMKMERLFIFDVNNKQEDYAACLEFMKLYEINDNLNQSGKEALYELSKKIHISAALMKKNVAYRYIEQPINISDRNGVSSKSAVIKKHDLRKEDLSQMINAPDIHYHIRVHLRENGSEETLEQIHFIQLQYLALLMRRVEELDFFSQQTRKKLSVFMVPSTGEEYPFQNQDGNVDYDTYKLVSQYLRLLSLNYSGVIYGVAWEKKNMVVTSLDFRKSTKYETYFPLILVDEERYQRLFHENIPESVCRELFQMSGRSRFCNSRDENPERALYDVLAETAMKRILRVLGASQSPEMLLNMVLGESERPLIQFCLFAFMLHLEGKESEQGLIVKAGNIWHLAEELCQGLRQVVQNSIQHSPIHGCFFSFYLHTNRALESRIDFSVRVSRSYEDTEFVATDSRGQMEALEVFISDLNEQDDMLENFCRNLENELSLFQKPDGELQFEGHRGLLDKRESLAVRNFFSKFYDGDMVDAWTQFRRQDLVAHVGLSLFALTAKRCKASVKVLSSKRSILTNSKGYFYEPFGAANNQKHYELPKEEMVIPGTQFSVLIPIYEWGENPDSGLGQLQHRNYAVENYSSFAEYIDYKEDREFVKYASEKIGLEREYKITSAKDKYFLVRLWTDFWKRKIAGDIKKGGNYVFNHDFSQVYQDEYFKSADYMEVCIKGLIEAIGMLHDYQGKLMLALTNLPSGFTEVFRKISILLGVRAFPVNLQVCLCENDYNYMMTLLGPDFLHVIYNSYVLSLEHGVKSFIRKDYEQASALARELSASKAGEETETMTGVGVFPFDAVLTCSEEKRWTIFEDRVEKMAENPLDQEPSGYKLNSTHMRLGSKVHIESFYEMSFLFYRTTIANRIAFIILRHMEHELKQKSGQDINIKEDAIIFFGYASYSKAILTSLTEILRLCREEQYQNKVAFASYQYNLQSESERIQIYFGLPTGFPGEVNGENQLKPRERVHIVQVVPISSTLTTFDKMWSMFLHSVEADLLKNLNVAANYTVFWVVDRAGVLEKGQPSEIEKYYWETVQDRRVETKFDALMRAGSSYVYYFMRAAVIWHDPLKCKLCYPDMVIEEIPLVETDPTSTVPSQQIRFQKLTKNRVLDDDNIRMNNRRILELENCIYYGHIYRRQNHYQYYIDTQKFFYQAKDNVMDWLKNQKNKPEAKSDVPVLHIIFSPEHNTNVGFAQYVNVYYFNGLAEIVSLNVDKEFRSNFICEHAALMKIIGKLHQDTGVTTSLPAKFYFVDDTIISGETFEKANSFLHSLIPDEVKGLYPATLFEKVFLLVDRLSDDTKRMYVERIEENFLSYIHVDISNVRIQGDSCIGCKMEQNARKMFKRSATRNLSTYWAGKLRDYHKVAYDDRLEMDKIDKTKSYQRLLVSHVLQNLIVGNGNAFQIGDAYDVFIHMGLWMLKDKTVWNTKADLQEAKDNFGGFDFLLQEVRGLDGVKIMLKMVCRPFFSFDFKIRQQVLTLYLCITELFLGVECESILPLEQKKGSRKQFLYEKGRLPATEELVLLIRCHLKKQGISELAFLQDYLLEGLTDIGSTYLMRKQTIVKIYNYIERGPHLGDIPFELEKKKEFWENYAVNIHRLTVNSADETKELWLEYLYMSGMEHGEFLKHYSHEEEYYQPVFLYNMISTNREDSYFYQFCHEVFLQNMGINFDGLEKMFQQKSTKNKNKGDAYFMEYWRQMRRLEQFRVTNGEQECVSEAECRLFELLKGEENQKLEDIAVGEKKEEKDSVNEWYGKFLNLIVQMVHEKYKINEKEINIALMTDNIDEDEPGERMQSLDIVRECLHSNCKNLASIRYEMKYQITRALDNHGDTLCNLEKNGYMVSELQGLQEDQRPYLIIFFDNPYTVFAGESAGRSLNKIQRVFLYLSINRNEEDYKIYFHLRFILRDILTFRNRILRFLEKDFSGDIFSRYARTVGEKNILSHEKAASHNATADDEITIELFVRPDMLKVYKELKEADVAKWLLLRNYTNGQIAKIFNRSFRNRWEVRGGSAEIPPLYVSSQQINDEAWLFKQELNRFWQLGIEARDGKGMDERFRLLKEIMDIECGGLADAEFIRSEDGRCFNLEYFKCIVIDICMSAIKFESDRADYLLRVDHFLAIKRGTLKLRPDSDKIKCKIQMYRHKRDSGSADDLVIRNQVDKLAHNLIDWEVQNEMIAKRLVDPLDYVDGHMSLLAIKRYIENLEKTLDLKCQFHYDMADDLLCFETRLPVLKGV